MGLWDLIKSVFKKKPKVEVREDSAPVEIKQFIKDHNGEYLKCELCQEPIEVGQQKTFGGKKTHLDCYREARKEVKRRYGV